jgi:hypothetical protein
MPRYVYDKDLECLVEIGNGSNREPPRKRGKPLGVISDIEPYRAAGSDVACQNKRPVIGGRRQHREFLARNGYIEVGNERVTPRREELSRTGRISDIKRAIER